MIYAVYDIATTSTAPVMAGWMAARAPLRPLLGRFRPNLQHAPANAIWLQACSVGEVGVAASLVERTVARWPDLPTLVTSSTVTGMRRIGELLPGTASAWFPIDHRATVRGFLKRAQPRVLVLVETEIWPNTIRHARRAGVPVVIVNGRISDKHFPRYQRFRSILRPVLCQLSGVAAQNETYAERFCGLGVPESRVQITGNTKFDGLVTHIDPDVLETLRHSAGLAQSTPTIVFGSTRPGDEQLAADCWSKIRETYPSAHLVLAPRHVDRTDEIVSLFREPVRFRSRRRPTGPDSRVLIVDTLGELISFYGLSDIAVVGGSFYPGVNGHNPLEPAALGVPTVFGPFMRNFMDPAEALVAYCGAIQVAAPDELGEALDRVLRFPERASALVSGARAAIAANQGATERTLAFLEPYINEGKGP